MEFTNNYNIEHDPVFYVSEDETREDAEYSGWDTGWYFWDETWSDPVGPFSTQAEARKSLEDYARELYAQ